MMSEYEFSVWCAQNNVSSLTKDYINKNIRFAQPARTVGGGEIGVSGRYPSKKVGLTIVTEHIISGFDFHITPVENLK